MTAEYAESTIDKILEERSSQIPEGIKNYIQLLKEKGLLIQTINFKAPTGVALSIDQQLNDEFGNNLRKLLMPENPKSQAMAAFRLTWFLYIFDETNIQEMDHDKKKIYRTWPEQISFLESKEVSVIHDCQKLLEKIPMN